MSILNTAVTSTLSSADVGKIARAFWHSNHPRKDGPQVQVKALVAKLDDLNSIPRPMWWKKRKDSPKLFSDSQTWALTDTHTHTRNSCFSKWTKLSGDRAQKEECLSNMLGAWASSQYYIYCPGWWCIPIIPAFVSRGRRIRCSSLTT